MGSTADTITLYTNHRCPWAHRAHIVIKELGLKYEEVIIDLDKPREPWYLEVNPVRPPPDPQSARCESVE
jgi:glutathione S-transferase